jgi:hypothetical protein
MGENDGAADVVLDVVAPPDAPYPCGNETCQPTQYCLVSCEPGPGCEPFPYDAGVDGGCPAGWEPMGVGLPESGVCCAPVPVLHRWCIRGAGRWLPVARRTEARLRLPDLRNGAHIETQTPEPQRCPDAHC